MFCDYAVPGRANSLKCSIRENLYTERHSGAFAAFVLLFALLWCPLLTAQTGGDGAIQGTVSDQTGAVVANALITATNAGTGVVTTRHASHSGFYSISPLPAGAYTVTVTCPGFEKLVRPNITVDALQTVGLNLSLTVGKDTQEITVTDAPPIMDTTNATLGGTIENDMYSALPLQQNGGPRDPTAFAFLMPGTSEGTSGRGVYGGSGQANLNETYLDGMPLTDASAQGNGKQISQSVSVDSVNQFQVQTNGSSVSFQGIGSTNYTLKTGTNTFHGTVFDYLRNTAFDSWGYFSKLPAATGVSIKPTEHQNSYGVSLGGPIFKNKMFFFGTYEGFHYTRTSNTPQYISIPTLLERQGDFTEVLGTASGSTPAPNQVYDPLTEGSCTAANKGVHCRYAAMGMKNGVPTANVVPAGEISPISQYLESFLPPPTNGNVQNNYLAGLPLGNSNYTINARVDYTISPRQSISVLGVGGNRGFINGPDYANLAQLPVPYARAIYLNQRGATGIIDYNFVVTPTLVNQLKYGYSRQWGPSFSPTFNTKYDATSAGITNLPSGNAAQTFPGVSFGSGSDAPGGWASNQNGGPGGVNSYTLMDTVNWLKGAHAMSFGFQYQWLQTNGASFGGYSANINLAYANTETARYISNGTGIYTGTGFAYASYLYGAVDNTNLKLQSITDVGARYHPYAPYFQDNWRVRPNLTLNLGLRWDFFPPYREVQDRIAFVDPLAMNSAVGIPGIIRYGGNGPNGCHCHSEVRPYYGNFEPRLGLAYAVKPNLVFRMGFGISNTHAGGVGGRQNATTGTGDNQFNATNIYSKNGNAASFFLNPNGGAVANSAFPAYTTPTNTQDPLACTGNYIPAGAKAAVSPCNPTYADTYLGGRGPQFMNWNVGLQRMINKYGILDINYAGSQTHFLAGGGGRGWAQNTYSADYLVLGNLLAQQAAGVDPSTHQTYLQEAQAIIPGLKLPFPGFTGRYATIGALLTPFPQYTNTSDIWGQSGNANYNALQISLVQRPWHGVMGMINYTRAREIDDTGYHRSQYPVGPADGNFAKQYRQDRVDRNLGGQSQTNNVNMLGVYRLPFGRGQWLGSNNRFVSALAGGWVVSGIYRYRDGYPIAITGASGICNTPGQGTCFPDYNPSFARKSIRINGAWGRTGTAATAPTTRYLDDSAFQAPAPYKLGNLASMAPYNVHGPGQWDIDGGLRRTIPLHENVTFTFEADVFNLTNSTFFNLAGSSTQFNIPYSASGGSNTELNNAFGTVAGQSNPPRDWQFAGRVSF